MNANASARPDLTAQYIVVGGGMVGSAMALGLAELGFSVILLEAFPAQPFDVAQAPDLRMSALALASVNLLEDLNAWQHIKAMRVQPYNRLSVWEKSWAKTSFHASEVDHDLLGYFVENRITQLGLVNAIAEYDNVQILHHKVKRVDTASAVVICEDDTVIQGDWIIAADGSQSLVRQQSGIATVGWQYDQKAMGITIKSRYPDEETAFNAQHTTWQAFKPSGPVAFLPMHDNYASLVWYDNPQRLLQLQEMDNNALHQAIVEHFPDVLGDFEVIDKASFTLNRMHAQRYIKDKVILIGDAAHAINPLAGQGVNLGFADVACLLQAIADDKSLAQHYEMPRRAANLQMMSAMDALYCLFSNNNIVLSPLRNLGLFIADNAGWAKHQVLKRAMGLHLPR